MNRCSIFKLLAGAACAAAMEITGLVPSLPRAAKYVVNPEWLSAAYEDVVIYSSALSVEARQTAEEKGPVWYDLRVKRGEQLDEVVSLTMPELPPEVLSDAAPNRYRFANGEFQHIPQYIPQYILES